MADLEKKDEKTRQWRSYSCSQLSAFCLQISLLLEAAVPHPVNDAAAKTAASAADIILIFFTIK